MLHRLVGLKGNYAILRNVELSDERGRTELDMVVLTEKAQIIIEVKNTRKNIFIDETGAYYRKGEYQSFDCNIKDKMNYREQLLKDAITETLVGRGKEVNIIKLVVFTNNRIELRNKCNELEICFLGELPYLIDDYAGKKLYSEEDIVALSEIIGDSTESFEYEVEMDMQKFKEDFVKVLVILENYEEQREDVLEQTEKIEIPYFLTKECADKKNKIKDIASIVACMISVASIGTVAIKVMKKCKKQEV